MTSPDNLNPTARRVLAFIQANPGCTRSGIWQALSGVTRNQVINATASLYAYGLIGRQPRLASAGSVGSGWRFYPEAVVNA